MYSDRIDEYRTPYSATNLLVPSPDADFSVNMSTVKSIIVVYIRHNIQKLAASPRQSSREESHSILHIEDEQLPGEDGVENMLPMWGKAELDKHEGKCGKGGSNRRDLSVGGSCVFLYPLDLGGVRDGDLVLLNDHIVFLVAQDLDGEKEALETQGAEMPRVKRVDTHAGEELRRGIVLPEASAGGRVPEGEHGRSVEGSQDLRVGVRSDEAEILNSRFRRRRRRRRRRRGRSSQRRGRGSGFQGFHPQ